MKGLLLQFQFVYKWELYYVVNNKREASLAPKLSSYSVFFKGLSSRFHWEKI